MIIGAISTNFRTMKREWWISIDEYENSAGQHAVKIETPVNGVYWEHVLIYDQNNKRIKTLKYFGGRYRS
jgi:ligand-binding SRPBCC domain-containing protein